MGERRNYISAPVTGEQIHDWFEFARKGEKKLTPEQEDELAVQCLSAVVFRERAALWLNPETDSKRTGAKAFGTPLELDGTPLKYVQPTEAAIFPPREVA